MRLLLEKSERLEMFKLDLKSYEEDKSHNDLRC